MGLLLILSQGLPEPNIINKRTTLRFLFTTNRCLWVGMAKNYQTMLGDFIDLIVAMFDRMLTFFIIGGGVVLLALLWNTLTKEKK